MRKSEHLHFILCPLDLALLAWLTATHHLAERATSIKRRRYDPITVASRAMVATLVAIMMSVGFQATSEARATVAPDTHWGDSYGLTVAGLGANVMKNQADLDSLITWMNGLPGLTDQGYYGAENDARTRTITLQWRGTSSLQAQILDQAQKRAININIHAVAFTRHQGR